MKRVQRPRRSWTPEFKAEAVKLVLSGRRSIAAIARELDVTRTVLRDWVLRAQAEQPTVKPSTSKSAATFDREEVAQLRKENVQLRMERDFLKKAAAFFANENK